LIEAIVQEDILEMLYFNNTCVIRYKKNNCVHLYD